MVRLSRPLAALAVVASAALALPTAATAAPMSDPSAPAPVAAHEDGPNNIVGGWQSTTTYPWMASLSISTDEGTFSCGGSQISRDIILTAQHCVEGDVNSVQVRIGSNNKYSGGAVRNATHLRTGSGVERGDWAVLKIQPYDNSEYLKLPSSTSLNQGPTFKAMGWGTTTEGGGSPTMLREVNLPFIPDSKCGAGSNEICAGDYYNGGIDTCQGDSGGPLIIKDSYGRWNQVGVVSWGNGCARAYEPGHYTEVTTYKSAIVNAISAMGGSQPSAY